MKLPLEIKKIILDYKFSIEKHEKFSHVLDELKNNTYFCCNCNFNKSYNITPIVYNCKDCDKPICLKCVDECDKEICINCYILSDLIHNIQKILGRKLTFKEFDIIMPYVYNIDFKQLIQINILISQLLEQVLRCYEIHIDRPSFKNLFLRLKRIKKILNNNVIFYIEEIDESDFETFDEDNNHLNNTF